MTHRTLLGAAALATAGLLAACAGRPMNDMSFFVTSANPGKGGDLGGLAGADAWCQQLAAAAGAGHRTWHAYLSQQPIGAPGVNARDRIGAGPWKNAKGVVIATSVADLHANNRIDKTTALDERGQTINGSGDSPNEHDILTGSQPDGTYIAGDANSTCRNWTQSNGGAAMVGHHDRRGLDTSVPAMSWNSSHQSSGCSLPELRASGGAGRFYCFATN
jgi:hypothetical protein